MIDRKDFTDEEWSKLRMIVKMYLDEHPEFSVNQTVQI